MPKRASRRSTESPRTPRRSSLRHAQRFQPRSKSGMFDSEVLIADIHGEHRPPGHMRLVRPNDGLLEPNMRHRRLVDMPSPGHSTFFIWGFSLSRREHASNYDANISWLRRDHRWVDTSRPDGHNWMPRYRQELTLTLNGPYPKVAYTRLRLPRAERTCQSPKYGFRLLVSKGRRFRTCRSRQDQFQRCDVTPNNSSDIHQLPADTSRASHS
ncbi:hypothetical protein PR001_g24194 [Phytophthora rubi]|uniref:Uncharacterized protein n=1 Tax=Phytophthora rubi TaxID=129364 RepID=A0A6A3IGX0_9STRA|nr:hypothetical protein PR001_g24194 [Phytophthora rubi]